MWFERPVSKFDVYVDVHKYTRKLSVKKYFLNKNSNPVSISGNASIAVDSGLKNHSLFNPPNTANQHLEVFKNLVLQDLDKLKPKKNVNPRNIKEGIEMLETRNDIIIMPVDKGGGVVILSKDYYNNQLMKLPSDTDT